MNAAMYHQLIQQHQPVIPMHSQPGINNSLLHTQTLIDKLTQHFQMSNNMHNPQFTPNDNRMMLQNTLTNIIHKASSHVLSSHSSPLCTPPTSPPSMEHPHSTYSENIPRESTLNSIPEEESFFFNNSQNYQPPQLYSNTPLEYVENKSISDMGLDRNVFNQVSDDFFSNFSEHCNFNQSSITRNNSLAKCNSVTKCIQPLAKCNSNSMSNIVHIIQDLPLPQVINSEQVQVALAQVKLEKMVPPPPPPKSFAEMSSFPVENVVDFKHLIYNLLVDNYNHPKEATFVQPIAVEVLGVTRYGFKFNEAENPDKRLPELYAQHIRKADLHLENQNSIFIQDLYKFYLRACVELLSKYFIKQDKHTFFYDDIPLFVPGGSLKDAEARISKMGTIQRKHKKRSMSESSEPQSMLRGPNNQMAKTIKQKRATAEPLPTLNMDRKKRSKLL